jgi:hypothetical protein
MSQVVALPDTVAGERSSGAGLFAAVTLLLAAAAAFLSGWVPLGFSIVTVFLFAGPHNWIEARYVMARLPGRWGKLRSYFLVGFAGILGLTAVYAAMPLAAEYWAWDFETWYTASAAWNSAIVLWLLLLIHMRSRQNPRREWSWTIPFGLALVALTWLEPMLWGMGIVYLHPLVALWILDRELRRSKPEWRSTYHACLLCVPLLLGLLYWRLASSPDLPGDDALSIRIAQHAGAGILNGVSTHFLVAAHTFLEMLHYSVWLVAIPLVGVRRWPWRLDGVPMARRSASWRGGLACILVVGGLVVLGLWACFLANYPLTRDVYFTVAMLHVLAEAPFLLRAL